MVVERDLCIFLKAKYAEREPGVLKNVQVYDFRGGSCGVDVG
jgi:hypothetical protein